MAAPTVNIADFSSRGANRRSDFAPQQATENPARLKLVQQAAAVERANEIGGPENPAVLDINSARGSHRMRNGTAPHSVTLSGHRSNMVRFNEPQVAVMKISPEQAVESRSRSYDDRDLPPAA